jgi:hypothetical protein
VAFAAPDWVDAAAGAGTMTDANRALLGVLAWAVLITAVVFDWSRLRRASFVHPVNWLLGVLLLPMYMILRAGGCISRCKWLRSLGRCCR